MIALGVLAAYFVAGWLAKEDAPQTSDAIVVLAGEPLRALHAADLFHAGIAPRVLVSRPVRTARERMLDELRIYFPRAEHLYRGVLMSRKVPAARIEIFGDASMSTVDEARVLASIFPGEARLTVVTSAYHARRAGMILRDHLPRARIFISTTPQEAFPERWWKDQDAARNVLLETAKILFYVIGGRFTATPS